MYEEKFMREAIRLAVENVKQGTGGPFGAVVVKEGKIIAACANTVTPDCDPTAHAEVNAIREACRKLDTFQLGGCEIYVNYLTKLQWYEKKSSDPISGPFKEV